MGDIFALMRDRVVQALAMIVPDLPYAATDKVEVTPARDPTHGDMATNAALVVGKPARQPPPKLAAQLVAAMLALPEVETAEAAGPGFVNIRLRTETLRAVLPAILRAGEGYGNSRLGNGARVNVEYVSANPTGPLHVGHCRGAVVGDALANLLAKAGFDVRKEFYSNDAGAQVDALAWAAYWRYLQALGTTMTEDEFATRVPGGLQYRGDYLIDVGRRIAERYGNDLAAEGAMPAASALWHDRVRSEAVAILNDEIRTDLRELGINHDIWVSERALVDSGEVDKVIEDMTARGLIYEGVLEPPKGKTPDDWEPREQTLFRATEFGDDVDRPLRKSDGSNTYFANDIAYHADKIARGFTTLIDVWGADHGGYIKRMVAAVDAISERRARLDVIVTQIVRVLKDGEPVRMSKRAGTYVTLRDLIDWVGRDAVRFTMLTRKADAQMEFDLDAALAQTRENPVFYVQYAHARCRSVLRAASEMFGAETSAAHALAEVPLDSLEAEPELALIRRLAQWPRTVEAAAIAREPHRIAFFLYDLAADFHMLWHRGKDDSALRFLQAERPAETRARLALVAATAIVVRSGLAVMGVAPVEEMR